MTTKAAILASMATVVGAIVLSILFLVIFIKPSSPGAQRRAGQLGQAVGMVTLLPLGGIWIAWAARVRKEREKKK